jgi:hypothetical protein
MIIFKLYYRKLESKMVVFATRDTKLMQTDVNSLYWQKARKEVIRNNSEILHKKKKR